MNKGVDERITVYHIQYYIVTRRNQMTKNPEEERKERVIHTRIPQSLDDEIREHAAKLGVSVSNLVRNVLQNAVELVGDVVADTHNIAEVVKKVDGAASGLRHKPPVVLGWQKVILEVNALCDKCNEILPRGTEAAVALAEGRAVRLMRCLECLGKEDSNE